ncbi:RNA polymerase, sigma-24 subunit, ECF subfamily [Natranaerobius thermophilus JW/NM-WN-LF]|uniref:RNA polymerase, sigma-24 subunit, ECF subfamily n=1 Tax=Natranaerobius thermophilus (strain ATCC BAA-1301 / DSM 18059 / JW/NM-WN-LF) TaxID=457570 RepID=B2A648_NATTJ|nr:RNA polymerase, sigma-24 subunit, ECF subfamily [Natranaerobius thermophilus JW/NM-WN-LF]
MTIMKSNDEFLVKQCQNGHLDAFEELVHKYHQKVYSLCYRFSGNHDDANDLAQEAFIRVYHSINKFHFKSAFSTWLYRVTSNVCLDEMRKRKRKSSVSLDSPMETDDGELYFNLPDQKFNPELMAERKDVQEIVHKAIQELPKDQKLTLLLREMEGFSYDEMAEVMNVSVGTVKSRLSRARNNLKEILVQKTELFPDKSHLKGKEV